MPCPGWPNSPDTGSTRRRDRPRTAPPGGLITSSRVLTGLTDAATSAAATVWRVPAGALPHLLAAPKLVPRLAELLALAARTAEIAQAKGDMPGLADTAARPGSGRLLTEARRLRTVLAAADPG